LERLYRDQLTEDGYKHEILAEFGEQEEGVYQFKYIEAAQAEFEYGQYKPTTAHDISNWIFSIGVDWNEPRIGTTIAVIGYNRSDGHFYFVDKDIVSRGEWTQLAACQRIAEMNRLWNPAFIYIDKGHGGTQYEILRKYGYDSIRNPQKGKSHPDSKLFQIVKAYDFGSSIETHDLITGMPIKKPAKPFLVENSVRRFESLTFHYPKTDSRYTKALSGYIIDRITPAGQPVYKMQDEEAGDHMLDAVNLGLLAFTLEKTEFGRPYFDASISFAARIGAPVDEKPSRDKRFDNEKEKHRPTPGRGEVGQSNQLNLFSQPEGVPARHHTLGPPVRLWRNPGFAHDGPSPTPRSREEAFREAERRLLGPRRYRPSRPSRAKF
jgi:replicative DNA helicase